MGDFIAELRRRHIYRVGAGYVVIAWAVTQFVDVLSQVFALPAWIAQPVLLCLAFGLPVVLFGTWIIEGKESQASVAPVPTSIGAVDWLLLCALIVVTILTAYSVTVGRSNIAFWYNPRLPNSIAVLPFSNLSADPGNAYIAAGIHESLLNQLVQIRNLNVISRTSVLPYANSELPVSRIAEELRVETLMEGSVQYANGRVLITAQLIDPDTATRFSVGTLRPRIRRFLRNPSRNCYEYREHA